jgi:hypothetical protein
MNGQMFISYRREESRWSAGRLYDRLTKHFDRKQVFMDIDGIALGDDFVKVIEQRVGECDVLIAVIGTSWLTSTDEQGGRRLDNPDDFVRMEIATALRRDIRVIPVLVDAALMPRSTDLPDDLKALVRRNGLRVSDTGFDDDCRRLISAIEQISEKNTAEQRDKTLLENANSDPLPVLTRKSPYTLIWKIASCLSIIWLIGLWFHIGGGLIHIFLVIVLIMVVVALLFRL